MRALVAIPIVLLSTPVRLVADAAAVRDGRGLPATLVTVARRAGDRGILLRVGGRLLARRRGSGGQPELELCGSEAVDTAVVTPGRGGRVDCVTPLYRQAGSTRPVLFHADELTLGFEGWLPAQERQRVIDRLGARVILRTRVPGYLALRLTGDVDLAEALDLVRDRPGIRFAEPLYLDPPAERGALPDDPLASDQWAIENSGQLGCFRPGVDMRLLEAWKLSRGDPAVIVAVLDTGIDAGHPDLADQLLPRGDADWNFALASAREPDDSSGHGTCVAGLVAAGANNGVGVSGAAPFCRLMPLKVDGLAFTLHVTEAIDYVRRLAETNPDLRIVVNGSLTTGTDSIAVREAVREARAAGVVLVFASGNGNGEVDYPARYPETLAVGALAPDGWRKRPGGCGGGGWGSSFGEALDLVAPGVLLPTTDVRGPGGQSPGDYHEAFGGTSAASPLVAAVAALLLSIDPELSPPDVRALLAGTAVDGEGHPEEDRPGRDPYMGWGRVDAAAALEAARTARRFVRGDADLDGAVALGDALVILRATFLATGELRCRSAGDVDDDGRLTILDPILLVRYLFARADAPSAPHPEPGLDPTPDGLGMCRQ